MSTSRNFYILAFLVLTSALLTACGNAQDELSRAQQEVDTRQYAQAVTRLEELGTREPEIANSEPYIDLLTSAYLGKSGVDLIDTLGHWAENYETIQSEQAALSSENYKSMVTHLIPPQLRMEGITELEKALTLCNARLKNASEHGTTPSKRILIKTAFVNFWALLDQLKSEFLPALEKIFSPGMSNDRCNGFVVSLVSLKKISNYSSNIALSVALLGEPENLQINNLMALSQMTNSLDWLNQYSSCEQFTNEEIEKIKNRFVSH